MVPTREADLSSYKGPIIVLIICDPSVQNQSHVAENIN